MELTVQSRQTSKQNSRTHINGANTFKGDVPQPNFNGNEKYSTTRLYADIIGVENSYSVPLKPEGPRSSVTLEWKNVSYAVKQRKEKKTLVKSMYGKALPGTMTAIMGPSGAGKTTLMNVLSGHYEKGYEGEVQVNGWIRDTELFNRQSCYVMQDDCLLPELTVRESLDMSIRLRMPSLQPAKRAHFVNNALSRWGLEDCHNTRAGQLSGGQRKRLSIAQEVVSNPPVIFLDEPTSGLDSSSALRCVSVMKSLASAGHTIICSIHNPSAKLFYYFDMLYMISNGSCIYNGSVQELLPFLQTQGLNCPTHHNPADYITEIASGEHGDVQTQLSVHFMPQGVDAGSGNVILSSERSITRYGGRIMTRQELEDARAQHRENVSYIVQFTVLLRRCFLCIVRNQVATHLRYAAYLAFAVMLIALFYGIGDEAARAINNLSLVILMLSILLFQSTMPTAMIFPTELSVLLRENRNCWYKPGMYYIARVLTEVPFMLLGPTAMVVAVYWATSQPAELWRLASVVLLCLQTCSTTQGLALVVSASTSAQTALFVALPAASPSFLFSGYFMPPKLLHPAVAWVTQLSHLHHALQGILYALYGSGRAELHCDEDTFCFFADPEQVLAETGAEDAWLPLKFCILLAMDAMYKTIAYVILRWRLRLKK
ncbi:ATP-binding cassette sub-family G member 1 isoform X2 [Dermacentor silvarum]|uniref:ATP-binding cassette sub-family G member 1 isoform X2 n=1 Tax=Dermacentor silvarum TaxID=543639 RepID=UPI001898BFF5|nr:ATP-binding cassette sub-family G member 1 isoform X2 [Dermacentor silvarum]